MGNCFIFMSFRNIYFLYTYICLIYLCKDENAQSLLVSNQLVYNSEATEIFI